MAEALRGKMVFWMPIAPEGVLTTAQFQDRCDNEFTCGLCGQTERMATYREGVPVTVKDERHGMATCRGWHWRPGLLTCPDCTEHL